MNKQTTPAGKRPKYFRFRIIINRNVQLQFVGVLMLISLLTTIQLLAQIFVLDVDIMEEAAKYGLDKNPLATSFIVVQHKALLIKLFTFLGINLLLIAGFGLFFSHRVSGPMYRTQQFLKRLTQGDLSGDLSFRKTDLFKEVATSMNEFLSALRIDHQNTVERMEQAKQLLAQKRSDDAEAILTDLIRHQKQRTQGKTE